MHDLADELLRSAKRKAAEIAAKGGVNAGYRGTIDFMVVTEAATMGVEKVRQEVLSERAFAFPTSDKVSLTERPYTYEGLKRLLEHVRKFKEAGFPTTSLHAIYESLFISRVQAQVNTLAALGRAKDKPREAGMEFFRAFSVDDATLPWRKIDDRFFTPIGDLVEIYQFVH